MTRALARSHFHRSSLIRVLCDLALVDAVEPGRAFAEKLGQWVDIASAITLRSVHSASVATPAGVKAPVKADLAMGEEFARVRAALTQAIQKSELPKPGGPLEVVPTFEPYRRYYVAQQRDMALKVPRLQARVRAVLAGATPALKQLAALDEVFTTMLSEREDKLLSKLPSLLALRFKHLQQCSPQADQPGGWLVRFGHELQTVLLAELEVRLQPTVGLLEALNPHFDQEKINYA